MHTKTQSAPPKICIVGAGIAGLRCADILLQHGFKVTVLEARGRIGGRAHQASLKSGHLVDLGRKSFGAIFPTSHASRVIYSVDVLRVDNTQNTVSTPKSTLLGIADPRFCGLANWIHGTDGNPILDLANATSTATHTWGEELNVFGEDGKLLKDGKEINNVMWKIIAEAFKYSAQNTSTIDPNESLNDFFKGKAEEYFGGEGESDKKKILMQMAELWGTFVGSSLLSQSLKFFWLEECIDGGIYLPRLLCSSG
jgi:hypothetical protein